MFYSISAGRVISLSPDAPYLLMAGLALPYEGFFLE
jgi:hypothetical protein